MVSQLGEGARGTDTPSPLSPWLGLPGSERVSSRCIIQGWREMLVLGVEVGRAGAEVLRRRGHGEGTTVSARLPFEGQTMRSRH